MFIQVHSTPNPNTLKFIIDRKIVAKGAYTFEKSDTVIVDAPIANDLFRVEGVYKIFITDDFFAITKEEDGGWDMLKHDVLAILNDYFATNHGMVIADKSEVKTKKIDSKDISNIEKEILEILDNKVRPAVAQDGGDVQFDRFEDGVVYLILQGACSGCPSATITLKQGIERMLKHYIPEIQSVESV